MKAILEFQLPEEASEHRSALDGGKWAAVCWELDQWLRSLAKYEDKTNVKIADVRKRISEEMDDSGLRFED